MTFLFLGIDGVDMNLAEEYNFNDKISDTPVELQRLKQDLPEVIAEKGNDSNNDGLWTFYIWGAMASGQIETPEMRQNHPTRSQVEYPLKLKYLRHAPSMIKRYIKGRLKRRPRYKSFAWDSFENVKVINYPIHLPEYNENAELVRDDAASRDYGPKELDLLKTEINNALRQNYDAVFVVTRIVDCKCHGATHPANFGENNIDDWYEKSAGKKFEEMHEHGMDMDDFVNEEEIQVSDEQEKDAAEIKQDVLDHIEDSYNDVADLINSVNWESVDEHVVVSDHGFDSLGAGSVNAHGRNAVLSCSFGYWRKMSAFIQNWQDALENKLEKGDTYNA